MDVNASAIRVSVLRVQPFQPEDTSDYRVAPRRIGPKDFARRPAIFEYHTGWSAIADFLCDCHSSQRRPTAAWLIAQTETRSGHFITREVLVSVIKIQRLIDDAHYNPVILVLRRAGTEKQAEKKTQNTSEPVEPIAAGNSKSGHKGDPTVHTGHMGLNRRTRS